jgi:CubicO group peptidase (beta-lactamase class C family)
MDDVITRAQILRLVERQRELNFEPGSEYLYSNTGYTLLAEIVERVTGQSFSSWTTEHIFSPLGMEDTHFQDDHQALVPNRAYSYQYDAAGGFRNAVLSYANVGATGLFSTVEDLSKWAANFETAEVGGPDLIRLMRSRGVLNTGDTIDYAMGQAMGTYRGLLALYHGGADAGYRTYLLRFPQQRLSVVVLANLAGIDAGQLARGVAEIYLDGQFTKAGNGSDRMALNNGDAVSTDSSAASIHPDSIQLEEYSGTYYADELGALYTLGITADTLFATHLRLGSIALFPSGRDSFLTNQWFIREVRFERNGAGEITGFRASNERVRNVLFAKQGR